MLSGSRISEFACPACGANRGTSCGDLALSPERQPTAITRLGWMHDERAQAVILAHGMTMMFRVPHVAERLHMFSAIVADSLLWTAIGAVAEYGVVLAGDKKSFPIAYAWMDESAWRLQGFTGFQPSRDRETALIIGDGLSLACAVLASLCAAIEGDDHDENL